MRPMSARFQASFGSSPRGAEATQSLPQLERLFDVMAQGSFCAFGQLMPGPMSQMLRYFGEHILR